MHWNAQDALCLDGSRLVLHSGEPLAVGAVYRQLREGFRRVEVIAPDVPDPAFPDKVGFKVVDRSGVQHFYGGSAASRMRHGADDYGWFRTRSVDTFGNEINYAYELDEAPVFGGTDTMDIRLAEVAYAEGGSQGHLVELEYEDRILDTTAYFSGALQRTTDRLASISTSTSGTPLRKYRLHYGESQATHREVLEAVEGCGFEHDGTEVCLPPTVFEWEHAGPFDWYPAASDPNPGWDEADSNSPFIPQQQAARYYVIADIDADGVQEMVYYDADTVGWKRWAIDESGSVNITSATPPEPHAAKVLRPIAVNFDSDAESEILIPTCAAEPGGEANTECRVEAHAYEDLADDAWIPYTESLEILDDPRGEGLDLASEPLLLDRALPSRIYLLSPAADVDADGHADLFVCAGEAYGTSTWHLLHSQGNLGGGGAQPSFEPFDLRINCSDYDRFEGPADVDGDGAADLLLGRNPSNPLVNYGQEGIYRRLVLPGAELAKGTLGDFLASGSYAPSDWLVPTDLPVDNVVNFLATSCAWANEEVVPDELESEVAVAHFNTYLANTRGQGATRWADFNGDGYADALRLDVSTHSLSTPEPGVPEDLEYLADLCNADDGQLPAGTAPPQLRVWFNRGGVFAPSTSSVVHEYGADDVNTIAEEIGLFQLSTFVSDLNLDGVADIQFERSSEDDDCRTTTYFGMPDLGVVEADDRPSTCSVLPATYEGATILDRPFRSSFQAQVDGGRTAFVTLAETPGGIEGPDGVVPTEFSAQIFNHQATDYLEHITDGFGVHNQFIYAVSADPEVYTSSGACDPEHRCLVAGSMWLVKGLRSDAGLTDTNQHHTTTWAYSDGRFGRAGRGFLGFEEVESVTREDDGTAFVPPIGMVRRHYDFVYQDEFRDFPFADTPSTILRDHVIAATGVDPRRKITRTAIVQAAKHSPGSAGYFVVPGQRVEEDLEFPTSSCASAEHPCTFDEVTAVLGSADSEVERATATSTTETDDYGTPVSVESVIGELATTTVFADFIYDDIDWILGLPQKVTVTSTTHTGEKVSRTERLQYSPATRAVVQTTRAPTDDEYWLQTDVARDDFGNVKSVVATNVDGDVRTSAAQYDGTAGVALDLSINGLGHSTAVLEQAGTGLVLAVEEPNGSYVENEYDAFGRLTATRRYGSYPGTVTDGHDLSVSRHWDNSVENSLYRVDASWATGAKTRTYFDRLDRQVRACWRGMSAAEHGAPTELHGVWICRDTAYTIRGDVDRVSTPFFEGTAPVAFRTFDYDNLGRLVAATSAEGRETHFEHEFDRTRSFDSDGNAYTTVADERGRVRSTVDPMGTTVCYEYGPFDLVERIVRNCYNPTGDGPPAGPAPPDIEFHHDDYGNVVSSYHPDTGSLTRTYSPGFLELDTVADAAGNWTSYEYDAIGRVDGIWLAGGEWIDITWDVDKLGLPAQVTGPGLTQESFEYDEFLRLTSHETIVDGDQYTFDYSYFGGRLDSIGYPGSTSINYHYDGAGYLREIHSDGALVWRANERNLLGQLRRASFGNDLETVRAHDWDGYLLSSNTSSVEIPGHVVERMDYAWNELGQLESRTDLLSNQSQTFRYDGVDRLTETTTRRGPNVVDLEAYKYDALGNLLSKTGVGTYEYDYATTGNRATAVAGTHYNWSKTGHLETRGDETFTWTSRGMLETYTSSTADFEHVYSGSGARVRTLDYVEDSHTTFVGGLFQEKVTSTETLRRFLVPGPDGMVAQLTKTVPAFGFTSETWEYLHPDHLGSPRLTTNEDGEVESEVMFDPWGAVRAAEDWTQVPGGVPMLGLDYTGHDERLSSDLVNMNARYFDTRVGRSISADSIIPDPLDSQSLNRYAYVLNNPLRYTDPTGHAPAGTAPDAEPPSGGESPVCNGYQDCRREVHVSDVNGIPAGAESAADQIAESHGAGVGQNHRPAATLTWESTGNSAKARANSTYDPTWTKRRNAANVSKYGPLLPYDSSAPKENGCSGTCADYAHGLNTPNMNPAETDHAEMAVTAQEMIENRNSSPGAGAAYLTALILEEGGVGLALRGLGWLWKARKARLAAKGGGHFRRGANVGVFSSLEIPMQLRAVKRIAKRAGVGLKGVKLKIVRDPELVGRDLFGHASPNGTITLYPDAFQSTETLVKTLGHERTHIMQFKIHGPPSGLVDGRLNEEAAFGIEETFWHFFQRGQ